MSLKENLKNKIRIEALTHKIAFTMRETPGDRKLNKEATRDLLSLTDFEQVRARDLTLYLRPFKGEIKEVLVLDNELPIYHSTAADVAMRKTPHWKEMFNVRNIVKVLNDKDVIASRGHESLNRVREIALAQLDFTFSVEDLDRMMRDGQVALNKGLLEPLMESLELFFVLLGFQPITAAGQEEHIQLFARPGAGTDDAPLYEDLIVLNEKKVDLLLLKGDFAPAAEKDLARLLQSIHGELEADAKGEEVFDYLRQLALQSSS